MNIMSLESGFILPVECFKMYCSFLISRCPIIEVCNKTANINNTYIAS